MTPGVRSNWTSPYSTISNRFPHGSLKWTPRPLEDLEARALGVALHRLLVVDDEAEVAVVVGRLPASLADREELVAQVDERHPRHAPAQLEVEEPRVELQRLVEVADLERDVVDPDQSGHGEAASTSMRVMRPSRIS